MRVNFEFVNLHFYLLNTFLLTQANYKVFKKQPVQRAFFDIKGLDGAASGGQQITPSLIMYTRGGSPPSLYIINVQGGVEGPPFAIDLGGQRVSPPLYINHL